MLANSSYKLTVNTQIYISLTSIEQVSHPGNIKLINNVWMGVNKTTIGSDWGEFQPKLTMFVSFN